MSHNFAASATQCLEDDHRQLDATLLESEKAAAAGDFSQARKQFSVFASGLVAHIDAEEKILFPELEHMQPGARGPTSVMRAEHEELRGLLKRIEADLTAATGWQASMLRLKEILLNHNAKEERVLYPMANAAAQAQDKTTNLAERLGTALSHGA